MSKVFPQGHIRASVPLAATVTEFDKPGRLVWGGGVPGIFSAEHSFDFKDMGKTTMVTTREVFSGILTGPLQLMVSKEDLENMHQQWLDAIKKKMEK